MSPSVLLTHRLHRRTHFLGEGIGNELVLLDVEAGSYFGLDEMGVEIWNAMESEPLAGDLIAMLAQRFDVPLAQVEQDVLPFLSQLHEHGLISVA